MSWKRSLCRRHVPQGDPTGWFDRLYRAGESGHVAVPWSRSEAQHFLTDWAASRSLHGGGRRAIVVGCALGADAEFVACLGYETTAFDISPAAIRLTRRRHRGSPVHYTVADLLDFRRTWTRAFDLVVEIITVQALPDPPRSDAIANVGRLVGSAACWWRSLWRSPRMRAERRKRRRGPSSREEIDHFAVDGLDQVSVEVLSLPGTPDEYRWRAEFIRTRPPDDLACRNRRQIRAYHTDHNWIS